jgi:hypothetical protein
VLGHEHLRLPQAEQLTNVPCRCLV